MSNITTYPSATQTTDPASRWPNNTVTLTTEAALADRGRRIVVREPRDWQGHTPVWTLDVFGRNELHVIKD
jgi:hypothetical protein